MRFELVRNLTGNEIVAENLYDGFGKLLLLKGSKITRARINKIKQNGYYYVHVEDDALSDVVVDDQIKKLKNTTLQRIPNIFNEIMDGNDKSINEVGELVCGLVDYISYKGEVNTNLYELNKYDNYTYVHCVDTSLMAILLGKALKYDDFRLKKLGMAAILHDVGKVEVPESILNKKGFLDEEEMEIMKKHPIFGYEALKKNGIKDIEILTAVLGHHERIDGKGYPFGLKDGQISEFTKIISISDVFTALSANRSYRPRYNPNDAYECILAGMNSMFDTHLVEKFKETFSIYPLGCKIKLSSGSAGYVIKQNKGFPDRPVIRLKEGGDVDLLDNTNLTIVSIAD